MALTRLQSQLLQAITDGDDVSELLLEFQNDNDKDFKDKSWNTPLHLACMMKNEAAIDLLLENGFDYALRRANFKGLTPLHILCTKDSQSLMPKSKKKQNKNNQLIEMKREKNNTNVNDPLFSNKSEDDEIYIEEQKNSATIRCITLLLKRNDAIDAITRESIQKLEELKKTNPNLARNIKMAALPESLQELSTATRFGKYAPLHLACQHFGDDVNVITAMLWNDPSRIQSMLVNKTLLNETPFHIVCKFGTAEVIALLFKSLLDSEQALATAKKHNTNAGDGAVTGGLVGTAVPVLGGFLIQVIGIGVAIFVPPVGGGIIFAGTAVMSLAWLPGYLAGMGLGAYFGAYLGKEFNPMQIIAEYNTAEVMIEFCKQMPADILTHYYNDTEPFTQPVYKMVADRHTKSPAAYFLLPEDFHSLVSQQVCFHRGLDYFLKKYQTFQKKPENVNARMNDFCEFITLFTAFFIQNKDIQLMPSQLENQLKRSIDEYVNGRGQQAVANINKTKSTFFGHATVFGVKVSDDLYNTYRTFLSTVDVSTLCYRHNELCAKVFAPLDEKAYKNKKAYELVKTVYGRIQDAFIAGGYNPEAQQSKDEGENNIIIHENNNNNNSQGLNRS